VLARRERRRLRETWDCGDLVRQRIDEIYVAGAPRGNDEPLEFRRVPHVVEADSRSAVGQRDGKDHRLHCAARAGAAGRASGGARAAPAHASGSAAATLRSGASRTGSAPGGWIQVATAARAQRTRSTHRVARSGRSRAGARAARGGAATRRNRPGSAASRGHLRVLPTITGRRTPHHPEERHEARPPETRYNGSHLFTLAHCSASLKTGERATFLPRGSAPGCSKN